MAYEFSRLCKAASLDNIVRTVIDWSQQQVLAHNPNKQTGKIMLAGNCECLRYEDVVESMSFLKVSIFRRMNHRIELNNILRG